MEKKCKNCNGTGGWDISVPCDPMDIEFISDGEPMRLGYKDCFWCKGTGEISEERISEVKKIKKSIK
jgi:hypothetical protein